MRAAILGRAASSVWRSNSAGRSTSGAARAVLVHFVRHDPSALGFLSVSWDEVAALFTRLADGKLASSINPGPARRSALSRGLADGIVARLPLSVQMSAETALRAQSAAFRAWGSLGSVIARGGLRRLGPLLERLRSRASRRYLRARVSKRRRGYGGWLTMGADGLRRIDFRAAGTGIALRGTVLRSDSSASSGVVRSGDRALVPGVGGIPCSRFAIACSRSPARPRMTSPLMQKSAALLSRKLCRFRWGADSGWNT